MERRRPVFFSLVAEHIHSAAAAALCTLFKYSLVSLKDTHTVKKTWEDWAVWAFLVYAHPLWQWCCKKSTCMVSGYCTGVRVSKSMCIQGSCSVWHFLLSLCMLLSCVQHSRSCVFFWKCQGFHLSWKWCTDSGQTSVKSSQLILLPWHVKRQTECRLGLITFSLPPPLSIVVFLFLLCFCCCCCCFYLQCSAFLLP